jgi:hypothetical protein
MAFLPSSRLTVAEMAALAVSKGVGFEPPFRSPRSKLTVPSFSSIISLPALLPINPLM